MLSNHSLDLQGSPSQHPVPGFWKLAAGQALSLQPQHAGLLRVAQGQMWVTLGVAPHGAGNALGDYFLRAGEQLAVCPGQKVVLESFERAQQQAVFFDWTPSPALVQASVAQDAGAVTQPLRDLGQALGLVGVALLHLGSGLVAYGRQLVSNRPVVQAPQHCA